MIRIVWVNEDINHATDREGSCVDGTNVVYRLQDALNRRFAASQAGLTNPSPIQAWLRGEPYSRLGEGPWLLFMKLTPAWRELLDAKIAAGQADVTLIELPETANAESLKEQVLKAFDLKMAEACT